MFLRSTNRKKDGKSHRYYSVVENQRVAGGKSTQRTVLYLGEINDSQQSAWRKTLEVFDEEKQRTRNLSLFPDDREVPADTLDSLQVNLAGLELRRPRPFGNCWLASEVWRQLGLTEFWQERLPAGREDICWEKVLRLLVVNRLLEPGSEFRLHRHWFVESAMDTLRETDFAVAGKDRLYRCLDRIVEHKQDLFVHLKQKWAELFAADFEVLLYDLTSTYFEGEMEKCGKAKRGYSRDSRPDCVQVVIALIVTPDGFPLAYEVMDGNTSEQKTLQPLLDRIEKAYGQARRVWVMDRGIPTEARLKKMRERNISYLVGTPKGSINKHEKQWLELPWKQVRDSVQVKLYERQEELYVLARSDGRQAKEIAIRRKRLVRLLRKLRAMRRSLPGRDQLLLRIGAARKEAGRAFGFVAITLPGAAETVTRASLSLSRRQGQTAAGRAARWPLPAAVESDGGRSGCAVDPLYPANQYRGGIPLVEERSRPAPDPPSAGAARGGAYLRGLPRLLSAGDAQGPTPAARARAESEGIAGEAGIRSGDRCLDSDAR